MEICLTVSVQRTFEGCCRSLKPFFERGQTVISDAKNQGMFLQHPVYVIFTSFFALTPISLQSEVQKLT